MLVSPVNVAEGARAEVVRSLGRSVDDCLLDLHSDVHHNRSVFTLGGPGVEAAVRVVTGGAVANLDISAHAGAHPRMGVVDVVPFVPVGRPDLDEAVRARDRFAAWAGGELGVPVFLYGPERELPAVRRAAFRELGPDHGPDRPHRTAGAICAGARLPLVAWNVWLSVPNLALAQRIASEARALPGVRALGFALGDRVQVSFNLVEPSTTGPVAAYDFVAARAPVERCELVGLLPRAVLHTVPRERWELLDLDESRTVESRLERI